MDGYAFGGTVLKQSKEPRLNVPQHPPVGQFHQRQIDLKSLITPGCYPLFDAHIIHITSLMSRMSWIDMNVMNVTQVLSRIFANLAKTRDKYLKMSIIYIVVQK